MLILAITTGQGRHVITSYNRACDRSLLYFLAGMTMVAYLVCPIQMLDVRCAFFLTIGSHEVQTALLGAWSVTRELLYNLYGVSF